MQRNPVIEGSVMTDFKRKPKTKSQFLDSISDLNTGDDTKGKPGRPIVPDELKTKKTSISIRKSDEIIIDNIIDMLVKKGYKKPFPTASEVHRMGILALDNLSEDTIIKYFNNSKL